MRFALAVLAVFVCGCGDAFAHHGVEGAPVVVTGAGGGATSSNSASGAGGATGSAATTATGAGGYPEPECYLPADCLGTDGVCSWRTCVEGGCGYHFEPAGTALEGQVAGDCLVAACDGGGGVVQLDDLGDVPDDTPGDCLAWSYAKNLAAMPDDDDVENDGLECTADACSAGAPVHDAAAPGSVCSAGICDPAGACVAQIPVQCQTPAGTYTSCNGTAKAFTLHVLEPVFFVCGNDGSGVGYCAPGSACRVYHGANTYDGVCL